MKRFVCEETGDWMEVQIKGGKVALSLWTVACKGFEEGGWELSPRSARDLAVDLAMAARIVDPDSADYRRLVAEAEADLAAELTALAGPEETP